MTAARKSALLATGLLLAGCTSAGPSPSASPTPTDDAVTSKAVAERAVLDCPAGSIAPAGAPYCYPVPAGFRDVTAQVAVSATAGTAGEQHRTAIALGAKDLILVLVYPLAANADEVSTPALTAQLAGVVRSFQQQGFAFESTRPAEVPVDGARGLAYTAATKDYRSDFVFVFRGRTEVEINCQYAAFTEKLLRGCAAVRDGIQILTR